jgi:integrase/recombinase XerD
MTRSLRLEQWPEPDRAAWVAARTPAAFLEEDRPASHWSPARVRIAEQAYGQWLAYLGRQELLKGSPAQRATDDRLRAFVLELQGRVSPASVAMMVGALLRVLQVIEPGHDWATLQGVYRHLKRTAVPSRDKLARMVAASDLFELGLHLMDTLEGPHQRVYKATRFRDGLLIALLIAAPMRLKNFAGLVIGQHLVFGGQGYELRLAKAETKTRRPYHAAVPPQLTPFIDSWLGAHRTKLIAPGANACSRLWLDRWGRPMSSTAVRNQLESRTKAAFGKPIWPHLFRDCAVTELVDAAPEQIGLAPDLLGHADLGTTQKHYIQARGVVAHTRVLEMIARRRAQAREPGA